MYTERDYTYCPRCGTEFTEKVDRLLICGTCKLRFYINPKPCNAIFILDDKDNILLVKRKLEPHKGKWDVPGGFIEEGETLAESIDREIMEELHIKTRLEAILDGLADIYEFEGVTYHTLGIVVVSRLVSGTPQADDDAEECRFFSLDEALDIDFGFVSVKEGILLLQKYLAGQK